MFVDIGHHEQFHKWLPDGTTVQLFAFSALTMPLPVVKQIQLETHKTATCLPVFMVEFLLFWVPLKVGIVLRVF